MPPSLQGAEHQSILGDLLERGDHVVLVTPIDSSAPKGRMILPQVQAIRDILDAGATCSVTQVEELAGVLNGLKNAAEARCYGQPGIRQSQADRAREH